MEQLALHNFLKDYFKANDCEILTEQNGRIEVQLTDELDEFLMNRPFYWQYMKKLGKQGEPMQVAFVTDPSLKDESGEWIHFGSPRLHQMFKSLNEKGRFTRLYEQVNGNFQQVPLVPWLVLNLRVSFQGQQKMDKLLSIGLQLINGTMVSSFMENVNKLNFSSSISDYCFTITPIIKLRSAYKRVENFLEKYIMEDEHTWAKEALQRLNEEKELLKHFYSPPTEKPEEDEDHIKREEKFEQELNGLDERFQPMISVDVINGGIFYLTKESSSSFFH